MNILETLPVTLDDVLEAQKLLDGIIARTPVESSRALGAMVGGEVFFKCENLQRAGSFKVRGAYVRMARLSPEEKKRGVVAASAGNHAQGVAVAAKSLGIKARIYMPLGVALPKLAATRSHGADVILHGHNVDEALAEAQRYSDETGTVFVHPFDNVDVVAGQGTLGLEILEQIPQRRHHPDGRRRRRAPGRRGRGHQGPGPGTGPRNPDHRRAGRKRCRLPAVAGCRRPGAAEEGLHHG